VAYRPTFVDQNEGGGLFSFLPPPAARAAARFEQLFGTPHDVDIATLAAAHGIATLRVHEPDGLATALEVASATPGPHVVLVPTDRHANVGVHDEIHAAVAERLSSRG
jgi:2-succinyl-5-enolpyruvyl-6-hydroxy-3-cyclohexene-1-carboxylate synthase